MGREIKRVPVDFDAPRGEIWMGYAAPDAPAGLSEDETDAWHEEWDATKRYDPPEGEGWQVWETVSEGSPISPVFATAEELARHLSTVGDDWDERRIAEGRFGYTKDSLPSYEDALRFVRAGWGPSMAFVGGRMLNSYEAAAELRKEEGEVVS